MKSSSPCDNMLSDVRTLILGLGENPVREGLVDTPKRVASALLDMTAGFREDPGSVLRSAIFSEPDASGLVLVRDITFASVCEATLLPFTGRVHIGYIPDGGRVLGLSKLSRLTSIFARRLQTQSRLGREVLDALMEHLSPKGAAIVIEAHHHSLPVAEGPITTAAGRGCFDGASPAWNEFVGLLQLDSAHCVSVDGASDSGPSLEHLAGGGRQPRGPVTREEMHRAASSLIAAIGEDPSREGLQTTPEMYVEWLLRATEGYDAEGAAVGSKRGAGRTGRSYEDAAVFDLEVAGVLPPVTPEVLEGGGTGGAPRALPTQCVVVRMPFASQCEHHLIPFSGTVSVALLPSEAASDALPLLEAVDCEEVVRRFSRRLQVQERLTAEIADAVAEAGCGGRRLAGALVVCEAVHMCMVARGVEKPGSATVTYAARGCLADSSECMVRVLGLLSKAPQGSCAGPDPRLPSPQPSLPPPPSSRRRCCCSSAQ
uniref:GTP cyclohydrolase 1 n=1 Tax=Tetraselmis sp. GSL018 TaxID=582737 RepID=A0A061R2N2_9CHLO|mmetsp:Transcript_27473/g.65100  ORF Transcript_27473/g.65100 Transcript_27473/m.65100 type:complete len:486 (-) Transcript_27473:290-1747(-)